MSFELKPEIKQVLTKINFVERYEALSESSRDISAKADIIDISIEQVTKIINDLGYETKYDKKERFFKVGLVEDLPKYRIWFNVVLRSGVAEFIWVVYHNEEVRLGSPWSIYPKLLISPDKRIKPPLYSTSLDLEKLLRTALEMYEDFKQGVVDEYKISD
ncbi:hypothetical protein [Lacrimispora brassicae]